MQGTRIHIAKFGVAAFVATALLAGCSEQSQDDLARSAAKRSVHPVLADKFPGVPLEPSVDCVIDNANRKELLSLAADAVTGPNANTAEIVNNIVSRPATLKCLVANGLPALL